MGIEKADLDEWARNKPHDCACRQISRVDLGRAISRIKGAGARVVAIDLAFSECCPVGAGTPGAHDRLLTEALRKPGETALIAEANTADRVYFRKPPRELLGGATPAITSPVLHNPRGVIRGLSLVQSGVEVGDESPGDTSVAKERVFPPLSLAAYAAYEGDPCDVPAPNDREDTVSCAGLDTPVWPSEDIYALASVMPRKPEDTNYHVMLLNWAGGTGTFPMYSFRETLGAGEAVLKHRFAGKVVFIGALTDRRLTPWPAGAPAAAPPLVDQRRERWMSGIEIHANALDTLLTRRFLNPMSTPAAVLLLLGLSLVAAWGFTHLKTLHAVGLVALEFTALAVAAMYLVRVDYWLYTVIPATGASLAGASSGIYGYARSKREAAALTRLVQAQESATATIVHDLKQPLAAIGALAQVLRAQGQREGGAVSSPELLQLIEKEVKTAVGDIDDLLHARASAELPLQPQEFDIVGLISGLAIAQSLKSYAHEVEVRAPESGIQIVGDPRYLGKAVDNLIDNAIKYWPDGGVVVVEITRRAGEVSIKVIDKGLGIPAKSQMLIFERYERAVPDGVTISGTGIGLFSVKRIVEAHSGVITVESEPGKGSTFTVILPESPPRAASGRPGGAPA